MKIQLYLSIICYFTVTSAFSQEIISLDRASQTSSGEGVNAEVGLPVISPNSDRVVFASLASNLVANDTNSKIDIFLKDLVTGEVSKITDGGAINPTTGLLIESNDDSRAPVISAATPNGFFGIAFQSAADNIARKRIKFPDNNRKTDIFLAIPRRSDFLERISVGPGGLEANDDSEQASIASDPTNKQFLVAYSSNASNLLLEADTNNRADIFLAKVTIPKGDVFDPSEHIETVKVSGGVNGEAANARSLNPSISADGRFIVFESLATNLTNGTPPTERQIYLYDIAQKITILISKDSSGNPGNGRSQEASISYNGKFVVYTSRATNIVNDGFVPDGDSLQVFMFNTLTGQTVRVNTSSDGTPGNGKDGSLARAVVSPDGRFVLFSDAADNLISDDTNSKSDIFIKDLATSNILRVNQKSGSAEPDGASFGPTIAKSSYNSDTGRCTFVSNAQNLISNDSEGKPDIFYSTISIPPLPLTKETKIEVPPDLVLNENNKRVIVTLQSFSGISTAKLRSLSTSAAKNSPKMRYLIKLQQTDGPRKKRDIRTIYSKKNTLAVKSLKPGNYTLRYQAQVVKNDKVIQKTPYSPTVFFTTIDD